MAYFRRESFGSLTCCCRSREGGRLVERGPKANSGRKVGILGWTPGASPNIRMRNGEKISRSKLSIYKGRVV